MKVLLDLDRLLADGEIDERQYARFKELSVREGGTAAVNALVGFGVSATVAGVLALVQEAELAAVLGGALSVAGLVTRRFAGEAWGLAATVLLVVGTLVLGGAILALTEASLAGVAGVTAIAYLGMAAGRSRILAAEAAVATGCLAGYALAESGLENLVGPTFYILFYIGLGLTTFRLSELKALPAEDREPPLTFARVCVVLVNAAFLFGSFEGERAGLFNGRVLIPDWVFTLTWAVALVAVASWGVRSGRAWVVRLSAAAGTLHFYCQYFRFFGGEPLAMLFAGGIAIAGGLAWARTLRRERASGDAIESPP